MIDADAASDAATDPRLYTVIVIVLILGVLGTALMRGSTSLGKWLDERRRAAEARDDARVTDLEKDVAYLKGKVDGLELWRTDVTTKWGGHMVWDAQVYALARIHAPAEQVDKLGDPPNILPGN